MAQKKVDYNFVPEEYIYNVTIYQRSLNLNLDKYKFGQKQENNNEQKLKIATLKNLKHLIYYNSENSNVQEIITCLDTIKNNDYFKNETTGDDFIDEFIKIDKEKISIDLILKILQIVPTVRSIQTNNSIKDVIYKTRIFTFNGNEFVNKYYSDNTIFNKQKKTIKIQINEAIINAIKQDYLLGFKSGIDFLETDSIDYLNYVVFFNSFHCLNFIKNLNQDKFENVKRNFFNDKQELISDILKLKKKYWLDDPDDDFKTKYCYKKNDERMINIIEEYI